MRTRVPAGFGLIEWVFSLDGMTRKMTATLGVSLNSAPTQANVDELFLHMAIVWAPRLPTQYRFRDSRFYEGNGTSNPPFKTALINAPGTNANVLLYPPNVVHVVRKQTALAGRHGRGRMFIPGAKEGDASNVGVIPAATLATYDASLLALKNLIEGKAWIGNLMLIGHAGAPAPRQITALTMRPKLGSQVRRLRDVT